VFVFPLEFEFELPVTEFTDGGSMLVAFAGTVGFAFVSEFVT
jgi:hypothetical protein